MARKTLNANVHVNGEMYGPDYPENEVTPEVAKAIENPNVWEDDGLLEGQEDPSNYDGVDASVLKAEIKARNEGRDDADKIKASGSRDELAAALLADDEPHTP